MTDKGPGTAGGILFERLVASPAWQKASISWDEAKVLFRRWDKVLRRKGR